MSGDNKLVHFTAGAISGTLGCIVTCPLDVAKTRLQSSRFETYRETNGLSSNIVIKEVIKNNTGHSNTFNSIKTSADNKTTNMTNLKKTFQSKHFQQKMRCLSTLSAADIKSNHSVGIVKCIRYIVQTEGYRALFKGLMPTLVGVAPARAIYFTTYEYCKKTFSSALNTTSTSTALSSSTPPSNTPPSTANPSTYQNSIIHLLSAGSAGITVTTITNPIWMIRTRLQLNSRSEVPLTTLQCFRQIYQQYGIVGFYKGLTASYFGVIETAIHFVIYEAIKARIIENRPKPPTTKPFDTSPPPPLPPPPSLSSSSPSTSTFLLNSSHPTKPPSSLSTPLSSSSSSSPSSSSSSSSPSSSTSSSSFQSAPMSLCSVDGDEEDFFDVDQKVLSPEVPPLEFLKYMLAACTSKTIATFIAYPHEVARTRVREGNPKYTKFFGTLVTVAREEGVRSLYRGLVTQLIKHIPNTAIILTTYEAIVYVCTRKGL